MFLATTELKEFWDLSDELLLLGPWCVRFSDPDWLKDLRHRRSPNPWDDRGRLERCALYAQDIQENLLDALSGYLNSVHGTTLSRRYWRILLGGWLLYYTHQLIDRFTYVQDALAAHPDARSLALDPRDFIAPRDTAEFLPLYHTDHYNLQLYSLIFSFLGKDFPTARHAAPEFPAKPAGGWRRLTASALERASLGAVRAFVPDVVTDELYPTGRRLLGTLTAAAGGGMLPLLGSLPESLRVPAVYDDRRLGLARLEGRDEFRRLFFSTLPYALPALALEGFAQARAASPARGGRTPKTVFASVGLYYNDFFKLAAAEWVERGARLWGLQHGGQYGTAKYSLAEWHERAVCDRFHTWGWASGTGDERLRDLPVPRLSAAAARGALAKDASADGVLLLTIQNVRNTHHLFPHPLGWQWEEHFARLGEFIAELRARGVPTTVRPYPHDYGWAHAARLRSAHPGLTFDAGGVPLFERVRSVGLAATDYPGTPFFELLACDVPSVHFWDDAVWELRPEAVPFFDALKRARIVHPTARSAARHAAEVRASPRAWWDSPEVRKARTALVERYCRVRPGWLAEWRAALADGCAARRGLL